MELEDIGVSYKDVLKAEKEIDKKYWWLFTGFNNKKNKLLPV